MKTENETVLPAESIEVTTHYYWQCLSAAHHSYIATGILCLTQDVHAQNGPMNRMTRPCAVSLFVRYQSAVLQHSNQYSRGFINNISTF